MSARSGSKRATLRARAPEFGREFLRVVTGEKDLLLIAAGLAFYGLISVVPLAIVSMWIASLIAGSQQVDQLAQMAAQLTPQEVGVDRAIRRMAEMGSGVGASAIIAAIWPATAYGSGLRRAISRMSAAEEHRELPGLIGRALLILVILPIFVLGTLAGTFAVTTVFQDGLSRVAGWVLALANAVIGSGIVAVIIYRVFPPDRPSWREIFRGAAFTAAGIAVLSIGFTVYLAFGANFKEHYAISAMAAVVLLGLWLFLANAVLLAGYRVGRQT